MFLRLRVSKEAGCKVGKASVEGGGGEERCDEMVAPVRKKNGLYLCLWKERKKR